MNGFMYWVWQFVIGFIEAAFFILLLAGVNKYIPSPAFAFVAGFVCLFLMQTIKKMWRKTDVMDCADYCMAVCFQVLL